MEVQTAVSTHMNEAWSLRDGIPAQRRHWQGFFRAPTARSRCECARSRSGTSPGECTSTQPFDLPPERVLDRIAYPHSAVGVQNALDGHGAACRAEASSPGCVAAHRARRRACETTRRTTRNCGSRPSAPDSKDAAGARTAGRLSPTREEPAGRLAGLSDLNDARDSGVLTLHPDESYHVPEARSPRSEPCTTRGSGRNASGAVRDARRRSPRSPTRRSRADAHVVTLPVEWTVEHSRSLFQCRPWAPRSCSV